MSPDFKPSAVPFYKPMGAAMNKAQDFTREARAALVRARAEGLRSRAALGHGVRHIGSALRAGWLAIALTIDSGIDAEWPHGEDPHRLRTVRRWIARRLIWMHPEVFGTKAATKIQGCECDRRDPSSCSEGEPFGDGQHSWCYCQACHGGPSRSGHEAQK